MSNPYDKLQEVHNAHGYKADVDSIDEWCENEETSLEWFPKNTTLDIKTSSFFEIGAGSGNFLNILERHGIALYTGCEIGDHPIAQFKKFFPGKESWIIRGDAVAVLNSFNQKRFNCIIAVNVLEHLEGDYLIELLAAVSEKLEKSGEFWIYVPCAESINSMYLRYGDLTHKRLYTLKNMNTIGEMYGMEVVKASGRIINGKGIKYLIRYLHNKLLYWFNRFIFAFDIGIHKNAGVFSQDLLVILKKQ